MGYAWSGTSSDKLSTCNARLIELFTQVLKLSPIDWTITDGFRDAQRQNELYPKYTKLKFPHSAHNHYPSRAVDAIPLIDGKVDYEDRETLLFMRGFVYGVAATMGIKLKKTIHWDLPHYEI